MQWPRQQLPNHCVGRLSDPGESLARLGSGWDRDVGVGGVE